MSTTVFVIECVISLHLCCLLEESGRPKSLEERCAKLALDNERPHEAEHRYASKGELEFRREGCAFDGVDSLVQGALMVVRSVTPRTHAKT